MHAVIPYCDGKNASESNEYILCHVRSVDQKKDLQDTSLRSCYIEAQVDFYRLFACLHNLTMEAPQWSFFHIYPPYHQSTPPYDHNTPPDPFILVLLSLL